MDQNEIKTKIDAAWRAYRAGQQQAAVEHFITILAEVPDEIDAHWGLGLSYRHLGEREKARQRSRK